MTVLRPRRWLPAEHNAAPWLGCLRFGPAVAGAPGPQVALPVLLPARAAGEAWLAGDAVSRGSDGALHWRETGSWRYSWISADDSNEPLEALTHRLYAALLASLAGSACPQLLRLWNYVPRINAVEAGLERYRQFNAGRQRALLDAQRAAFEGAPAACALGPQQGPLTIACLSGTLAARPVENPRQVSAYRYPTAYGPRSPSFSRAAVVEAGDGRALLLISGTASIVGHESQHAGDARAQTDETLRNLQAVVEAASGPAQRFDLRRAQLNVYLRRAADADAVVAQLARALGADSPALRDLLVLQADVCRAELLVEIEGHVEAHDDTAA